MPSKRNLPPPNVQVIYTFLSIDLQNSHPYSLFPSFSTLLQKEIERVFAETDSLTSLTVLKKELIWEYREAFMGNPEALPIVLQSVDWLDKEG